MQKIKTIILSVILSLPLFLSFTPVLADHTPEHSIRGGVCDVAGQQNCSSEAATSSINDTIAAAINILSVIVGIVAVIMIIVAGFRYITSAGNEQNVATAKRTLIYALIGLIIVALAQVVVRFVLRNVT